MKTLKYRSAFASLGVAMLSVFLFTACEKDSDSDAPAKEPNRIEKFARLAFTTESGASSGSYVGANGSVSYTSASATSPSYTSADANGPAYTDPRSRGNSYSVRNPFSLGGGSVNIGGTDFPMSFAFCANDDLFGFLDLEGDSADSDEPSFDLFIGVSGDISLEDGFEMSDSSDNPLDLLLYVFSFNGGSELGSFASFEDEDDFDEVAFIIAIEFEEGEDEPNFWFATDGSVSFSGSDVLLAGVELTKVNIDGEEDDAALSNETVSMTGNLTCVEAPMDDDEM